MGVTVLRASNDFFSCLLSLSLGRVVCGAASARERVVVVRRARLSTRPSHEYARRRARQGRVVGGQ